MEVEFTARQVKVPKALHQQAEDGMARIARILGKTTHASVKLHAQRHMRIAELTVKSRQHVIVAEGKGSTLELALRHALAHAELQAQRYRDRNYQRKRLPKEEKVLTAPPVVRPKTRASAPARTNGSAKTGGAAARTAIAVHSFPASPAVVEPHVLSSEDAIAVKALTIEQAVKEAEFRDRDLLIFRSPDGDLFVLHRRRDGQMELVEIP